MLLFEDKRGAVLVPQEIDMMEPWEIEERGIHVFDIAESFEFRRHKTKT